MYYTWRGLFCSSLCCSSTSRRDNVGNCTQLLWGLGPLVSIHLLQDQENIRRCSIFLRKSILFLGTSARNKIFRNRLACAKQYRHLSTIDIFLGTFLLPSFSFASGYIARIIRKPLESGSSAGLGFLWREERVFRWCIRNNFIYNFQVLLKWPAAINCKVVCDDPGVSSWRKPVSLRAQGRKKNNGNNNNNN